MFALADHEVDPRSIDSTVRRLQILNRQTIMALSACEFINLTSFVGNFMYEMP